jgi:hypothetical protein
MDNSCAPVASKSSLVELGIGVDRVLPWFDVFGPGLGVDSEACPFFFAVELGLGVERKTRLFSTVFGAGLGDIGEGDGSAVELGAGLGDDGDGAGSAVGLGLDVERKTRWFLSGSRAGLGDDGEGGESAWTESVFLSIFCFQSSTFFCAWSRSGAREGSISALVMDSALAWSAEGSAGELGLDVERKTGWFMSGFGAGLEDDGGGDVSAVGLRAGLGDDGDGDGSAVELGLGVERKTRWFSSGFGARLGDDGDGGGSAWTKAAFLSTFCFKFSINFWAWSRSGAREGSISALVMDSALAFSSASSPLDFRSLFGVVGLTSSAFTLGAGFFSRRESCPVEPEVVSLPAQEGEQ